MNPPPRSQRTDPHNCGESPAKDDWTFEPQVDHGDLSPGEDFYFPTFPSQCNPIQNAAILSRPGNILFDERAGIYSRRNGIPLPRRKLEAAVTRRDPQRMSNSFPFGPFTVTEPVASTMSHIPRPMVTRGPVAFVPGHTSSQRLDDPGLMNTRFGDEGFGLSSEKGHRFPEACSPSGLGI